MTLSFRRSAKLLLAAGGAARCHSGQSSLGSQQQWLDLAKSVLRRRALLAITSSALTAGGTLFAAHLYSEAGVARAMCGVFEEGGLHGWQARFTKTLSRTASCDRSCTRT